jgi:hypothetical protein
MKRPTNNLCNAPCPTIRVADLNDSNASVHVVFDRPATPNEDYVSTEWIRVVMDRTGRILRHEDGPRIVRAKKKEADNNPEPTAAASPALGR